jgi:CrcB protein
MAERPANQPAEPASPVDPDPRPDRPAPVGGDAPAYAAQPFGVARRSRAPVPFAVVAVVAAGGAGGALARYGLGLAVPHRPGTFPWASFGINVTGCLLIGVLMVLVADVWPSHRLLRPFLGTGVLGGYTTFSTYVVDTNRLLGAGRFGVALAYLSGTLLAALVAVHAGIVATRLLYGRSSRP